MGQENLPIFLKNSSTPVPSIKNDSSFIALGRLMDAMDAMDAVDAQTVFEQTIQLTNVKSILVVAIT